MYSIDEQFINYNVGGDLSPLGLVIHATDNPGATAQNHHDFFNGGNRGASANAFVDWNEIIQLIDWHRASWHAGHTANYSRIGVELCEPKGYDEDKFNEVWNRGVWLSAHLLEKVIGTTVVTRDNVMSHAEASDRWGETDHQDPVSYFEEYGKTMDDFRNAVQQVLNGKDCGEGASSDSLDMDGMIGKVVHVTSYLNVRETPGGTVIGKLYNGDTVKLCRKEGNYYLTYFGDNGGYVSSNYVEIVNADSSDSDDIDGCTGTVVNAPSGLRVRETPGGAVIGTLPNGERIKLCRIEGDWILTYFGNSGGYVHKDYISY